MKTQHTKGEWANSIRGIKSDKGLLIAQCWYGDNSNAEGNLNAVPSIEEYHANAKLIAAAPELLEALQNITKTAYPKESNSGPAVYVKLQNIAMEAINKATE